MRLPEALEVLRGDSEVTARCAHRAQLALQDPLFDGRCGYFKHLGNLSGGQVMLSFPLHVRSVWGVVIAALVALVTNSIFSKKQTTRKRQWDWGVSARYRQESDRMSER